MVFHNHNYLWIDYRRLKEIWITTGLTKRDFAKKINVGEGLLNYWINKRATNAYMRRDSIDRLCEAFDCDYDYLSGASDVWSGKALVERRNKYTGKLRTLRLKRGLTQLALSLKVGCSQSMIECYELGKKKIDPNMQRRLAEYFNVTEKYLLGEE